MIRLLCALVLLSGCALSMPPPAGLNLKPAKAIGEQQPKVPLSVVPAEPSKEPPNLRLRSRMMAALNAVNDTGKKDLVPLGSQPLILTKNRKYKKPLSRSFFGAVTEEPITAEPPARPPPKTVIATKVKESEKRSNLENWSLSAAFLGELRCKPARHRQLSSKARQKMA
ncbi:hypothetical protein OESDEN_00907 [Oesophagostomum dentatum]|uniref:Uncharacterized protein n=1 Tax=Oesophagostomum dentatum TaxID=61180 RepID=A0A0B1TNK9_OESDE|nr:hypothetical protein OESDEN_00907 [Oesophagostomum dentatum]